MCQYVCDEILCSLLRYLLLEQDPWRGSFTKTLRNLILLAANSVDTLCETFNTGAIGYIVLGKMENIACLITMTHKAALENAGPSICTPRN
jgi:hypothetical protein